MHDTELEATYDASRFRLEANYGSILGYQRGTPYDLSAPMPDIFTGIASLKMPEVDGLLNARIQVAGSFDKSYDPASNDPSTETRSGYTTVDLYAT